MRDLFSPPPPAKRRLPRKKAGPPRIVASHTSRKEIRRVGREIVWKIVFEHLQLLQKRGTIPASRRRLAEMPVSRVFNRAFTEADKRLFKKCFMSERDLKWLTKVWWEVQTEE